MQNCILPLIATAPMNGCNHTPGLYPKDKLRWRREPQALGKLHSRLPSKGAVLRGGRVRTRGIHTLCPWAFL